MLLGQGDQQGPHLQIGGTGEDDIPSTFTDPDRVLGESDEVPAVRAEGVEQDAELSQGTVALPEFDLRAYRGDGQFRHSRGGPRRLSRCLG